MQTDKFWKIIEKARYRSQGDLVCFANELRTEIKGLNPDQLILFEETVDRFIDAAYDWKLLGAAHLINGGCSDDSFEYFRCWLIAQGRDIYERVLSDPDTLADVFGDADVDAEFESLLYIARGVFEEKTGQEMPVRKREYPEAPAGDRWDEIELPKLLPRLSRILHE